MAMNMGDSHLIVDILRQHRFPDVAGIVGDGSPRFGVELGCFRGATSQKLLQAFPHLMLVMVDQWRGDLPEDDPYQISGDGVAKLTQAEQDDNRAAAELATSFGGMAQRRVILKLPSETAVQRVGGRFFDFVFVDANHLYEAVKRDIELWLPTVRSGGIIAFHDYHHAHNRRGNFGVKRAVDEAFGDQIKTTGTIAWMVKQ